MLAQFARLVAPTARCGRRSTSGRRGPDDRLGARPTQKCSGRARWAAKPPGSARQPGATSLSRFVGRKRAATKPMAAATAIAVIASAYERFPEARSDTRIVPAMAVPNDDPRFETLRDSPEISP